MSWDWAFQQYIRKHLAQVTLGRHRKLAISVPPQHGKTSLVTNPYPVWRMAREPGLRVAIGAYSQTYANLLSRKSRRIARDSGLSLGEKNMANEWELSNGSSLYAVGVGTGISGRAIDMCILDDPHKNREEADSVAHRERIWEWYMDDITTRLQEKSSIVIIMTRWREDDLVGRILNSDDAKNWQYVRLPAIAEDRDPLGRVAGDPLCPQRFTLDTLLERKKILGEGFEGLYQQNPVPRGGLFFKRDWFASFVDDITPTPKIRRLRYWDLAATTRDTSAYTAGVLMAYDGSRYYVEHIIRDRLSPADRNELIRKTAELDAQRPGFERTWFEEQPGAAGIEVSQSIIKLLAGLPCRGDRVTGSKETRAEPVADAARAGLISIVRGGWNEQFLSELASFPRGSYKDQVDSFAGAYAKLARGELAFAVATTR